MSLFDPDYATRRLDQIEQELQATYDRLGDLTDTLYLEAAPPPGDDLGLNSLEKRLTWDEIRGYCLAARHGLHGGLTAIIKARGRLAAQRRPPRGDPGDPDPPTPPGVDDEARERSSAQD